MISLSCGLCCLNLWLMLGHMSGPINNGQLRLSIHFTTATLTVNMAQISLSGKLVPREYEVDYDLEPCYSHYGLRDGDINMYSKMLENEKFRTAVQVRYDTSDFVRRYNDELKLRLNGPDYLSLVNQWDKIQEHSVQHDGKFMPYYHIRRQEVQHRGPYVRQQDL